MMETADILSIKNSFRFKQELSTLHTQTTYFMLMQSRQFVIRTACGKGCFFRFVTIKYMKTNEDGNTSDFLKISAC